ncbi:MAG: hypothetical protein C0608_12060 [Deltaproteobacteria bacterium]|nr:MAG: hypothetical protein C0608_12060 [Deltaproteobacteria bacterium]
MGFFAKVKSAMKRHFLTGVLVFVPIVLTVYLVNWLDEVLMSQLSTLPPRFNPQSYIPFRVPGLGVILTIIIIYIVGAISSNYLGKKILEGYENLLERIPGVRWLYVVLKQMMEAVFNLLEEFQGKGSDRFRGVVLVEYPRKGIYSLAFVTGDTRGEIQERTASKVVNIFIPTTPNPTSGFYLMIPSDQLIRLDISVEQAFRMLMSAGMVGDQNYQGNKKARPQKGRAVETGNEEGA